MVKRVHDLLHVGPVLADRILDHLGGKNPDGSFKRDDATALATIQAKPHRLLEIKGIGRDTALTIYRTNFEARPNDVNLPGRSSKNRGAQQQGSPQKRPINGMPGIGALLAKRVIRTLGNAEGVDGPGSEELAYATIAKDPYKLLEVPGIGYHTARRVAIEVFNLPADDETHNRHGNVYLLSRNGGVLPLHKYREKRASLNLSPDKEHLGVEIQYGHAWLTEELEAETFLTSWLAEVQDADDLGDQLDDYDYSLIRMHGLNEEQTHAITTSLRKRACLLTGGAGTGKTTTVAAMIDIFRKRGLNVHVMTLAGKSAERVARACLNADVRLTDSNNYGSTIDQHAPYVDSAAGMTFVTTIHRGLRATGRGRFLIDQLAADVVIVDEASMVATRLLTEILYRLKPGARVILVGDDAQLPPIGYGAPFEDFIQIGLPHVHLTQNYRQADQENIHILATAIRNRKPLPFQSAAGVSIHTNSKTDLKLLATLDEQLKPNLSLLDWQVLTSTNKVRTRLNALLQEYCNPDGEPLARIYENREPQEVRYGDKIVIIRNDYEIDIMNGQTGLVTGVGRAAGSLTVRLDHREVEIPAELLNTHVRLGYCITVHKAQGSSWHTVISVEEGSIWHASNRLYYTSCTRAEHLIIFITNLNPQAWWSDVIKTEPPRASTLLSRITEKQANHRKF